MGELSGLVGVIGDVHTEDSALERILDYFDANRVTSVLCVGDIADGPGNVNRCCRLLQSFGAMTVRGNHDRWLFSGTLRDLPDATTLESVSGATREYLGLLPPTRAFESPAGSVLLGHGIGANDMALLTPFDSACMESAREPIAKLVSSGCAIYIGGHTHLPCLVRFPSLTVINAGTLRADQHPTCSLIDLDLGTWRLIGLVERRFEQRAVEYLSGPPTESVCGYFPVSCVDEVSG